ncbi:MAG: hypothetical protein MUC93_03470 [Bacteroidales bacterium]|jgi:hypothetical protein|nr:hypothetical protein [Bacteroidales bacterium]
MSNTLKILKYLLIFVTIAIFTGCAPARQNPFQDKRKRASRVNTSQLGRNRYYFSTGYQKKLVKNYKKK